MAMDVKYLGLCLFISALILSPFAANAGDNPLIGSWARDDGGTRIKIVTCGANLCATNTWVKDPNGKERVGDELILTLAPAADSELSGEGYDVRRKMKFRMTITLHSTTMHTSGCVLLGVFCKNADWSKENQ
jgi:uncharacterized protein (DUF2147 family)